LEYHTGVMLQEVLDMLKPEPGRVMLDCTVGGATHSREIAKRLSSTGTLVAIDKDIEAIEEAKEKLKDCKCEVILKQADFINMDKVCYESGVDRVDGILIDLGVSSHQLDRLERGFSYMSDGPLDMRMDVSQKFSAKELVNELDEQELAKILWKYGEERWAKNIARKIVQKRKVKEIKTTGELVQIIKEAIPAKARAKGPHPAKRSFQGFRIYVNAELEKIAPALEKGMELLKPKGRLAVISFHSLEDRIVKNKFRELEQDCRCPPKIPECRCDAYSEGKIITKKPIIPTDEEINCNPRARSAKLRVFEKESVND